MDFVVAQGLTGLASASALFLVASGLTIIFGVTRIVNFAHGSLYMLGAYGAYSLTTTLMPLAGGLGFWAGVLASALAVGAVGAALELLVMRRLYGSHELFQLLATFGVVLIVDDVALAVWGPQDLVAPRPPLLDGAVAIMGRAIPTYDLVLIALGPLVLVGLHWAFRRTRWGLLVRAATQDREMVGALGVNQRGLFTATVTLGAALAGLGGALQLPREAASLTMDMAVIAEAFVVTVVGGMGSVLGAFLAALIVAELNAFGILILPQISIVLLFLVMAVVLVVRPQGLLGRAELQASPTHGESEPLLIPGGPRTAAAAALAVAALAALPAVAGGYVISVATEILVMALFAASLQFVLGVGGMISFGHAAYLGLGAYGAALLTQYTGAPMTGALLLAPLAGGLGALVFGWFCVRLSGVYMAMLTLAFAQIAWAVAHQWVAVTGGSNGILGVWPAPWAGGVTAFYWLTLAVVAAAIALLWRTVFAPFGYGVRATRDSPRRAEAVGVNLHRQRWLGFTLGGVFAGLAGGLYAFLKGSVFPAVLAIPMSIDGLVMVLLGGVQTLIGPLLGAGVYDGLKTVLMSATDTWRAVVGAAIVLLCVAFPRGLVGNVKAWLTTRTGRAG
ncbi:amino acid/amide ABC transporter membrane protein 1, HAAT family /amino acid/amide ABC transporter membrane protein 2, HAAT family [Limimonas halophila]|uniref:Amino acid/amide ABC transporter membrane protein 1, HAAT family /amino acid/amide ABC transporter membrane protein 2, HAAT family n=1 Tax=Limimonas halophila TaxID=1082479 RepID=A0A1G7TQR6_9PROT|nr:ABC transporter permease [Limimonas halophila]SDG37304.1 amino acid/amide ABC transporter membrane protein 1, HAAT family /amino acid/amide ABC transporter membrane protein 2, HAAT family [Limimonas halophila]